MDPGTAPDGDGLARKLLWLAGGGLMAAVLSQLLDMFRRPSMADVEKLAILHARVDAHDEQLEQYHRRLEVVESQLRTLRSEGAGMRGDIDHMLRLLDSRDRR